MVRGQVNWEVDRQLGDFVIMRSNGSDGGFITVNASFVFMYGCVLIQECRCITSV